MVQCNLQPVAWMPSRSRSLPFPAGINNCTSHVCSPLRTQTGSQRPMPVRWQSRPSPNISSERGEADLWGKAEVDWL